MYYLFVCTKRQRLKSEYFPQTSGAAFHKNKTWWNTISRMLYELSLLDVIIE